MSQAIGCVGWQKLVKFFFLLQLHMMRPLGNAEFLQFEVIAVMPIVFAGYVGIYILVPAPDHSQTLHWLHLEWHLGQRFQPSAGCAVQLHHRHSWSESRYFVHSSLAGPVTGGTALGDIGVKQRRSNPNP